MAPSFHRATRRCDLFVLLLVLLSYLLFFPYYPRLHSANELSRLYLVYALVDDKDVEITKYIQKFGDINDKSKVAQSYFSDKPPGTAFVALLPIAIARLLGFKQAIERDLWLCRLASGILPVFLLLLLIRKEMKELQVREETRAIFLLLAGLGTVLFPYAILFYGHGLVAFLVFASFYLTISPSPLKAMFLGFASSLSVATEYQSALFILPSLVLFCSTLRHKKSLPLFFLLGALPPLVSLLLYHTYAFGSPFKTGYSFVSNPFFASVHAQGFIGVKFPRLEPFLGSLFYPSKGLLFYSPALVLGFSGLPLYFRKVSRSLLFHRICLVGLPILFVSSMVYWDGGWTVSQRHLTPLVPFLITPSALLFENSKITRLVSLGLILASICMISVSTIVFPHMPEYFTNPFHDLILPLLQKGYMVKTLLLSAKTLAIVFAFLVICALLFAIAIFPSTFAHKVTIVVLGILIGIAWFDITSRVSRFEKARVAEEVSKFELYFDRR